MEIKTIIYPQNRKTNAVVEIIYKDERIEARFEKNEEFRKIVKSLGYKWDGVWHRKINYPNGTIKDRVAELGNKLLNAGFPVNILDEEIRQKAINGDYEPEHKRWIWLRKEGEYTNWLVIKWVGKDERLYKIARKLPGSKWDNGVVVKIEYIDEIEEFAELYGFKFSEGAKRAIKEYKDVLANIIPVQPVQKNEENEKDGLTEILKSEGIIDDLRDDD